MDCDFGTVCRNQSCILVGCGRNDECLVDLELCDLGGGDGESPGVCSARCNVFNPCKDGLSCIGGLCLKISQDIVYGADGLDAGEIVEMSYDGNDFKDAENDVVEDFGIKDVGRTDSRIDSEHADMNQTDMDQPDDNTVEDLPVEDLSVEETEMPWMCSIDDDCADFYSVADFDQCQRPGCDIESGECAIISVHDGTECSDGDFCTAPDTCVSGKCIPGGVVTCDDGDACTYDECVGGACVNTPDTTILTCGVGRCYREVPACEAGVVNECIPGEPQAEICDAIDNDCNGFVDDDPAVPADPCEKCWTDPLSGTEYICGGIWSCQNTPSGKEWVCPAKIPSTEACNGIDDNCDGRTDESFELVGLPCMAGIGECLDFGSFVCNSMGVDVECSAFPGEPSPELCDLKDNNCDGLTDNNPVTNGMPCAVAGQLGNCQVGATGCANGLVVCNQINFPETEKCDGVDNNCNNQIDENSPGAGVACSTGLPGICNGGTTSCATGNLECVQTTFPQTEVCDGLDNDCDGVTDPVNTTGCTMFFKDQDGDGYGSAETACLCAAAAPFNTTVGGDCCDTDSRAKPVGAAPHTTQNNCNSWDYNCDGTVSRQYNYGDGSCGGLLFCKQDMVEGWKGAAPNCGEVGTFLEDCVLEFIPPVCQETTKKLTQGCI